MPANECIELYSSGRQITCRVTADVIGKRFVKVTGDRTPTAATTGLPITQSTLISVGPCTAAAKAFAVARNDAAAGQNVGTYGHGFIVPVTAGAAVTSGTEVECDSAGRCVPLASGRPCGYCVQGAANGADAQIRVY